MFFPNREQNSYLSSGKTSFPNSGVQSLVSSALPFLLAISLLTLGWNLYNAKQAGMAYLKSRLETPEEQLARAAGLLKYQTHNGGRTWVASQG